MSKILFIGDVHLSPRTPASRKDDYSETMLLKLRGLTSIIEQNEVKHLVFLGDLFNTKHMTLSYFIKCFQVFKDLKSSGVDLHLIVGNHDIYYNNESTMEDSPVQILLDSGLFDNKDFTSGKSNIYLFNYTTNTQDLPSISEQFSMYNILVGHYFYNLGFNDDEHTISKEQALSLKYNAYILGHDHNVYDPVNTSSYCVHRPGSLSRGTSHTCQINRDSIQVVLFDDTDFTYKYVDIFNVSPAKDVFKEVNLISKVSMTDIDQSLKDLLSSLDFNNSSDIVETLNSIPMSPSVKKVIVKYLSEEGIYVD